MGAGLWTRFLVVGGLLILFVGLFVWAGTVEPDPERHDYPDNTDIANTPEQYVGEQVTVDGTVVETDPLTIEGDVESGGTIVFVVENADVSVTEGEELWVYGQLQADNRVETINTVHRKSGERTYMFVVSFLAGLLVLGRLLNGWTVDTTDWTVVPRTDRRFSLTELIG